MTVAMVYLTLFLGHVTNMSLMREFLKFLLTGKCDDRSIINVVLNCIGSNNTNVSIINFTLCSLLITLAVEPQKRDTFGPTNLSLVERFSISQRYEVCIG